MVGLLPVPQQILALCVTDNAFISSFRWLNRCSSNQWAVKWLEQENTMNRQFWLPVNSASLCLDLFISSETKQGRKEQFRSRAPAEITTAATRGSARAEQSCVVAAAKRVLITQSAKRTSLPRVGLRLRDRFQAQIQWD